MWDGNSPLRRVTDALWARDKLKERERVAQTGHRSFGGNRVELYILVGLCAAIAVFIGAAILFG